MTPAGHLAVAYVTARATCLPVAAFVLGGVLPDVDFLLLPLASFNDLHRVLTHNLLFVVLAAGAVACVGRPAAGRRLTAAAAFAGGALHLFVDAVLDGNPSNGTGVALLWPFSDAMVSPFNLLESQADARGWADPVGRLAALPYALRFEVPFYLAALAQLWWGRQAPRRQAAPRAGNPP